MADITKKEIEQFFSAQTETILNAVDERFEKIDVHFSVQFQQAARERGEIRQSIRDLAVTLDNFLKRLTNYEEELTIIKAKLDKVASFIKEKFGIEITAQ